MLGSYPVDPTWSVCNGMAYRAIEENWMGMQESVNTLEITINHQTTEGNRELAGLLKKIISLFDKVPKAFLNSLSGPFLYV